jgi:hypothetical protein
MILSVGVKAQLKLADFEFQVKEISELEDKNEKEYRLAELSKTFSSFIKEFNSSVSVTDTSFIQYTKSSDSKYQVYYYNTYSGGMVYRLDWFIVFGDMDGRQVLHFYDKSFNPKEKKGLGEFRLHLSKAAYGDINLYPLSFSFKTDMKIYRQYRDIASICMYEQLGQRATKEERLALNDSIIERMNILWKGKEYFDDHFEGLQRISTLISDDKKVKVCTWNVALPNSSQLFFGVVVVRDKEGNVKLHPLKDATEKMRSPEKAMLSPKKWFGAVYYDIVSVKDKNKGNYYALLGYKPNDEMTKKKVIEPMVLINSSIPTFGRAVFQRDRVVDKRVIFEYAASTNMMLKYDRQHNRFVLDHLSPPSSLYNGNYRFYGPDFSFDSYEFEKGRWVLHKDVDLRNPGEN